MRESSRSGHAAFFGLGAYTAGLIGILVFRLLFGATSSFRAGATAGRPVARRRSLARGYATSFIIARFRHLTLIMITLGIVFLLHEAANQASWLTGGSDGLQGINIGPLLGISRSTLSATQPTPTP